MRRERGTRLIHRRIDGETKTRAQKSGVATVCVARERAERWEKTQKTFSKRGCHRGGNVRKKREGEGGSVDESKRQGGGSRQSERNGRGQKKKDISEIHKINYQKRGQDRHPRAPTKKHFPKRQEPTKRPTEWSLRSKKGRDSPTCSRRSPQPCRTPAGGVQAKGQNWGESHSHKKSKINQPQWEGETRGTRTVEEDL